MFLLSPLNSLDPQADHCPTGSHTGGAPSVNPLKPTESDPPAALRQAFQPILLAKLSGVRPGAAVPFLVVAALLAGSAGAAPPISAPPIKLPQPILLGAGSATATASPAAASAHPAALALTLRYSMTCNQPGAGPIVVTLPAAMKVGTDIAADAVLVRGRPARSVTVHGRTVAIGLPRPPLVLCHSIVPGKLTVLFTKGAGLENPATDGTYRVTVRVGGRAFAAPLTIIA